MICRKPTDSPRCAVGFALQMMILGDPYGSQIVGAPPGPEWGQGSCLAQLHNKHKRACPRGHYALHTKHFGARLWGPLRRGAHSQQGEGGGEDQSFRESQDGSRCLEQELSRGYVLNPKCGRKVFSQTCTGQQEDRGKV